MYNRTSVEASTLKYFAIFTGKHLRPATLLKRDSNTSGFSVNIAKTYFEEHLRIAAFASVFNKNKRCLHGRKNLVKLGLKS